MPCERPRLFLVPFELLFEFATGQTSELNQGLANVQMAGRALVRQNRDLSRGEITEIDSDFAKPAIDRPLLFENDADLIRIHPAFANRKFPDAQVHLVALVEGLPQLLVADQSEFDQELAKELKHESRPVRDCGNAREDSLVRIASNEGSLIDGS